MLRILIVCLWPVAVCAETFTVATFNVENYFLTPQGTRRAKPEVSRVKVVESIAQISPDVIALQEMGRPAALEDLRKRLGVKGLKYPHHAWVEQDGSPIHLAVLSKFPLKAKAHTDVTYLLNRQRLTVGRGFGGVQVRVNANYTFTLLNAHLKSKRPVPHASEAEIRLAEARELRKIVAARLGTDENILIVGDLNDTPDTDTIKELIGRRAPKLVDLRPFERNGDQAPHPANPKFVPRRVTWTSFYWKEDSFSRFDYILASGAMLKELDRAGTFVHASADWGVASDHRPVVARFVAEDR